MIKNIKMILLLIEGLIGIFFVFTFVPLVTMMAAMTKNQTIEAELHFKMSLWLDEWKERVEETSGIKIEDMNDGE